MKLFLILACMLSSSFSGWLTDMDKAKTEAAEKNRNILLNFSGSDWCIPCIRLKKEIFESIQFRSFADSNLILVNADFPHAMKNRLSKKQAEQNEALAQQYNPSGKFPFTLLLSAGGKIIKAWDGDSDLTAEALLRQIKMIPHAGN